MPEEKQEQLHEEVVEESKEKESKFGKKVPLAKYQELEKELEKARSDADHWKNEYYRAYADTQNLRKTLEEEKRDAIRYRAAGFIENLIPALDGFHMALSADTSKMSPEMKNWLLGFQYIYNNLLKVLEDEGVSEVAPAVGAEFDLNTMHAIETVETEGEPNKVVKVLAKGYKLHDRLIRPVMVSVSKRPAPKAEEPKQETTAPETPDEAHKA